MKALRITLEHGRVWVVETSDGKRAQAATLAGALDQLVPLSEADMAMQERPEERYGFLPSVFDGIRDSGSTGNIARGQASG